MSQFRGNPSRDRTNLCGGPHLGELSGGNWMAFGGLFLTELVSSGSDISIQFDYPYRFLTKFRSLSGELGCFGVLSAPWDGVQDSYLVDSASSHMLVSKIKPCMSKYKQLYCETANGSLNQL